MNNLEGTTDDARPPSYKQMMPNREHEASIQPYGAHVECMSMHRSARIHLLRDFPTFGQRIEQAVSHSWPRGIPATSTYDAAHEIKLRGGRGAQSWDGTTKCWIHADSSVRSLRLSTRRAVFSKPLGHE